MYVHKKWLCSDCNNAWAKRSKELAGQEIKFVVYHDENIPTDPEQFSKINATWIPPFQRFLDMFLPETKHKFVKMRRPAGYNIYPKPPQSTPNHIAFIFRNAPFNEGDSKHWAQSVTLKSGTGTKLEFKYPSDNSLEHLMLSLIHEYTAHIHISRFHSDIRHYTHEQKGYGSRFLPEDHPDKNLTGHCKQHYTNCLNGFVTYTDWLGNPDMIKLLQDIRFGGKPTLGFQIPLTFKFKAEPPKPIRKMGRDQSQPRRKLGKPITFKDNPPAGVGFITAQYKFEMPMPLIDFEGTIEDLRAGGFKAEQTFNLSGGDSIKTIQSKQHPGFSAWMNENSRLVRFVVRDEKNDDELVAFKQGLLTALGVKGNPLDAALPEKEEVEGESLITLLKKAKEHSDAGEYAKKKEIIVKLINKSPDDWSLDQPLGEDGSGRFPGVKHLSTSFQFHLPKNAIPDSIKPTPTGDDETKETKKETKKAEEKPKDRKWRPFIGETIASLDEAGIIADPIKTNPPEANKRRLSLDGVMEPSEVLFRMAFGFPKPKQKVGPFTIKEVKAERRLRVKNKIYEFPWQVIAEIDKKTSNKEIEKHFDHLLKNREVLPTSLGTSYMCELGFKNYQVTKANRLYITGTGKAERIMNNPAKLDSDGRLYIKDFTPISDKAVERKFRTEKLKGKLPSDDFLRQIYSKCQLFGEAAGWVLPTLSMKWKKGHPLLNETRVDGFVVPDSIAYWHTHPKAFEPSQTSPDDFLIYHGLFTMNGMKDFFTVMSDRIDHFKFTKQDQISPELMAETIMDFEDDVRNVFEDAMEEYQMGLKDNQPLSTEDQTRHIVKKLNRLIPEFYCTFNCYKMDANTILKNA
jgi:hypothetical protein